MVASALHSVVVEAAIAAFDVGGPEALAHAALPEDGPRPTIFSLPGLEAHPWWQLGQLPDRTAAALIALQDAAKEITAEFVALCASASTPRGSVWPRWLLLDEGSWVEEHCRRCPRTAELLRALPLCDSSLGYAYFSVLPPHARVGAHRGATNAKLRGHLPLELPPEGADCGIRVAGEVRAWQAAEVLLFDDSYEHDVWNGTELTRVVLLFDLWHPQLAAGQVARLRGHFAPTQAVDDEPASESTSLLASAWLATSASPRLAFPWAKRRVCPPSSWELLSGRDSLQTFFQCALEHLPVVDVAQAASVSASWRCAAASPPLWSQLVQRDFNERSCASGYQQYKELSPKLTRCPGVKHDVLLKFVMVGDAGTGKSSFVIRAVDNTFVDGYISTIGIDFKILMCRYQGKAAKVLLWDTAGPERFRTIQNAYFRGASGVIMVYDRTCPRSLDFLARVARDIRQVERKTEESLQYLVCGNKSDLSQVDAVAAGRRFAAEMGAVHVETSCKTGAGVDRAIAILLQHCMKEKALHATPIPVLPPPPPSRWEQAIGWAAGKIGAAVSW